ncbi:MAG: helix-turn-helix transcriptional regulator [Nitrospiria bacterium]
MNPAARRALNGKPIAEIPDPRQREGPTLFQSEAGLFRVRTTPNDCGRGKLIFLEALPCEQDFNPVLIKYGLSPREREVAILVIRGYTNREIAAALFICEQTVKDHLRHIYEKAKVHRRCELVAKIIGMKGPKAAEKSLPSE